MFFYAVTHRVWMQGNRIPTRPAHTDLAWNVG